MPLATGVPSGGGNPALYQRQRDLLVAFVGTDEICLLLWFRARLGKGVPIRLIDGLELDLVVDYCEYHPFQEMVTTRIGDCLCLPVI